MGYINPKGRDWSSVINFDDVGKAYCSIAIAWTVILFVGMGWLILHRNLPFLKMRNIPLAIAATITLHVYLVKILLAYTVNGHFPCDAEFWIMNIYLPFGIALFQANMVQLQSVSGQQNKFLEGQAFPPKIEVAKYRRGIRGLWRRWCAMTEAKRALILIAVGMLVQLFVSTTVFLVSRKFHSWGVVSHPAAPAKCRKGWEWVPSAFWQLVWAWFYGPYILYKIRNINDVHYWRIQTTLCVISGLPGTPIWLAALYSPKMHPVNIYWVPPMWLAPGIIVMQAVTIFFPIFEAYRSRYQLRNTLELVKSWEEKSKGGDSSNYSGSTRNNSLFSSRKSGSSTDILPSRRRDMYTMAALEKALSVNAIPLLHFAATKEFTGENITFLMQVRDWRAAWNRGLRDFGSVQGQARNHLYHIAVEIFAVSVYERTADFPINIEGRIRCRLEAVFATAIADVKQNSNNENIVDPFNHPPLGNISIISSTPLNTKLGQKDGPVEIDVSEKSPSDSQETILPSAKEFTFKVDSYVSDFVTIPEEFDEHIFDEAEKSVKYMVITNTWPRFVDSCREHEDMIRDKAI